jgi:hypothetical protein
LQEEKEEEMERRARADKVMVHGAEDEDAPPPLPPSLPPSLPASRPPPAEALAEMDRLRRLTEALRREVEKGKVRERGVFP